jgi:AcrR family transcriptional regulator
VKSQEGSLRPSSVAKRRAILEAAEEAFLAARYGDVKMDDIAEASQVSKQTVYSHFGTKDRLFVELVTTMTREAGDGLAEYRDPPSQHDGLVPWLEELLDQQLAVVLSPRLTRLRRLVISEVPRFPELARAVYEQGPRRAVVSFERLLGDLDQRGWLRVPDPALAAEHLNWLVMGGPTNAAMFLGDEVAPSAGARRAHVRAAVATFLRAYAAD